MERRPGVRLGCVLLLLAGSAGWAAGRDVGERRPATVRVMSYNLWHGGDAGKQPLEQTVAVIRAAGADVVGLQETAGLAPQGQPRPNRAAQIAGMLGWNHLDQGGAT